ncbi:hypothetical protein DEO72_LG6g948 [Vigna unguiculata]|uniref:Uncharacterized protein n=1 Tax=Vigna unguiculata TaxID=3917 RepID=A0A4D6M804_VIGUN|nr:hypothetical protein DEO72_LG6g948 [Vigna unguiculata]
MGRNCSHSGESSSLKRELFVWATTQLTWASLVEPTSSHSCKVRFKTHQQHRQCTSRKALQLQEHQRTEKGGTPARGWGSGKNPFLNQNKRTGKRKAKVGAQLTWRETHYKLGGKKKLIETLAELFASVVEGGRAKELSLRKRNPLLKLPVQAWARLQIEGTSRKALQLQEHQRTEKGGTPARGWGSGKNPFLNQNKRTGKRKAKVGAQLTWRETHYKLGGKKKLIETLAELFASVVEGGRVPVL